MALDFELIKKELEEAQRQAASDFWVPDLGENLIRILPPRDGKLFYRRFGVHYGLVGSGMELCPRLCFTKPCPVCETVDALRKVGSSGAMELVRRLAVVERFMMNVIVLSADVKNVRQYLAPKTVRLELLKVILDPDYGDITDLQTGRNVVIEKVQGSGGFANYVVRVKPNPVSVESLLGRKFTIEEIPEFEEILLGRVRSYEELKYLLFGGDESSLDGLVERYASVAGGGVKEDASSKVYATPESKSDVVKEVKVGGVEGKSDVEDLVRKAFEIFKSMG